MIGRPNRFHGRGSLQRHYKASSSVRSTSLTLRYARNDRRQTYRAAIVVSRKVSKSAVVRNRIRRRVYEHVRVLFGTTPTPYDLVFIVYDEKIATMPTLELSQEMTKLCRKAGLSALLPTEHAIVEPKE